MSDDTTAAAVPADDDFDLPNDQQSPKYVVFHPLTGLPTNARIELAGPEQPRARRPCSPAFLPSVRSTPWEADTLLAIIRAWRIASSAPQRKDVN